MSSRNERRAAKKLKKGGGDAVDLVSARAFEAYELYNKAVAARREGSIEDAKKLFRLCLKVNPDFFEALGYLGLTYESERNFPEALKCYRKALGINAVDKVLLNNIGNVYMRSGLPNEAEEWLEKALLIDPDYVPALNNLGNLCANQQRYQKAEEYLRKVLALAPDLIEVYLNLASLLNLQKRYDDALVVLEKAKQVAPHRADIYFNLGIILFDKYINEIQSLTPGSNDASRIGNIIDQAINAYKKVIEINEDDLQAHINLAVIYNGLTSVDEAIHACRSALDLCSQLLPEDAKQQRTHGPTAQAACEVVQSLNLYLSNFSEYLSKEDLYSAHRLHAQKYLDKAILRKARFVPRATANSKIKIGYVSPDFRSHSVAYFIEPILANHNRGDFEIYCYANVKKTDAVTERLRQYNCVWRDVAKISDDEVGRQIQNDRIDILVDLAGYTEGHRLHVFAHKPAPIQVTYLGYPNTTGMAAIDYRLTDAYADPQGQDQFYSEQLVRLPQSFLCYRPHLLAPQVAPLPVKQTGQITFGCFNAMPKINTSVIKAWSAILKQVPGSRLLLKNAALQHAHLRARVLAQFEVMGVPVDRLILLHRTPDIESHLALYHQIDIALDTFPYNGTTTTCEALWMGVPVIGLSGERHSSRVGLSLLSNIGLSQLMAQSEIEYINLAVNLAQDMERMHGLRQVMRDRLKTSPLLDESQFVARLEAAYRTMAHQSNIISI